MALLNGGIFYFKLPYLLTHKVIITLLTFIFVAKINFLMLRSNVPFVLRVLVAVGILTSPIIYSQFLDYSIGLTEPISYLAFAIGFLMLICALRGYGLTYAALAGFAIFVSEAFRSFAFVAGIAMIIALVVCALALKFYNYERRLQWRFLLCAIVISVSWGAPGVIARYANDGSMSHGQYVWTLLIREPSYFASVPHWYESGILTVCKLNKERCEELRAELQKDESLKFTIWHKKVRDFAISTVLTNPLSVVSAKMPHAVQYYFNDDQKSIIRSNDREYFWNTIYILLLVSAGYFAVVCAQSMPILLILIAASAGSLAVPFVFYFEARYFYLLKILFMCAPTLWCWPRKSTRIATS